MNIFTVKKDKQNNLVQEESRIVVLLGNHEKKYGQEKTDTYQYCQ